MSCNCPVTMCYNAIIKKEDAKSFIYIPPALPPGSHRGQTCVRGVGDYGQV